MTAVEHGSNSTYARYRCRCTPCVNAARAYRRQRYKQYLAARVHVPGVGLVNPRAKHGTLSGYTTFGCRCQQCTAAGAARYAR